MKPLRHRLEWIAFVAVRAGLRALPHRAARPLGARLGDLARWSAPGYRRVVDENLRRAFPSWSPSRRQRVLRDCFRHFGAMVCDLVSFGRFDAVELCERLTLEGWEHVEEAERSDRGTLFLSAHLGNWEIASHPVGLYRGTFHIVVRPFNNPLLRGPMLRERERFGHRMIEKHGAARDVFRVLRAGGRVGIVMDQRVRRGQGGILVPFFGHPALTTPLPAKVALRTGAPAVPIFAYPEPGGRYRVRVDSPIVPEGSSRSEDAVTELTRRYLGVFEREIRERPEQWLWMHRRWRMD